MRAVRVVLISTYELGRQPFGLASPAAWLRADGHEVTLADLAYSPLPQQAVCEADLIAFFLPMHTATRLFQKVVERIQDANPRAYLCAYGLYAPLNDGLLRRAGVSAVIGGEFEQGLRDLARRLSATPPGERPYRQPEPLISMARQQFLVPDRTGLPPLGAYAQLRTEDSTRRVGYTEASRGCKHLCRHCPVVPVYRGLFRIVQADVVIEDIRRQVSAGAEHITFGDPDFFNGPGHAMAIVEALHREWPALTYDVTVKVEHLEAVRERLPALLVADVDLVVLHVFTEETMPVMLDQPHYSMEALGKEFLTRHLPNAERVELRPRQVPRQVAEVCRESGADLVALSWCQDGSPGRAAVVWEVLAASTIPVLLLPLRGR